jgi:hypothetical protein
VIIGQFLGGLMSMNLGNFMAPPPEFFIPILEQLELEKLTASNFLLP